MTMGADYSFELIPLRPMYYAPQFIGQNKFFLGSVFIMEFSGEKKFHSSACKKVFGHRSKRKSLTFFLNLRVVKGQLI